MKKKANLFVFFLLFGLIATAQEVQISGKVTNVKDGSVLPGVTIFVKGTSQGTTTDIDGGYVMTVPGDAVLVFSFIGMKTKEVSVGGRTVLNISLEPEVTKLEEVIVTALGIKRSEKAIGYSVTTINSEEITKTRTSDAVSALAGKIAGVDISVSSSSPGASNSVIIRGISSLGGSNQPLYVVDGVPILNNASINTDLNGGYDFGAGNQMFNPDDVESVTILKGAAASALYGNRASNGVVVITTKQGENNERIKVELNSSLTRSDLLRLPEFQNEYGMGWDGHHTSKENTSWGPKFDGTSRVWGNIYGNTQKVKPYEAVPDNVKDFYEYGWKYQNSVSVSGGNDKTTYYGALSHTEEDGIIPEDHDSFKKYTGTLKATHKYKSLKITSSVNLSRQENSFVPTGQGYTVMDNVAQTPRDISVVSLRDYKEDPFDNLDYYYTPYGIINPYIALDNLNTTYKGQKVFGKVQLEYEITKGLTATYRTGIDVSDNEIKEAFPRLVLTPGSPNYGEVNESGYVKKSMTRRQELNHDVFLNYKKAIKDFYVNVLSGLSLYDYSSSFLSAKVTRLDIPNFFDLDNSPEPPVVNETLVRKRMLGVYGSVELAYKSMVFLTLTGRQDKTSTLPKENNTYFYPGAQLSFVFSELLKGEGKVLSLGKLRLAWGKTGKDAGAYELDPYFRQASISNPYNDIEFPLSGQNAYSVGDILANNQLHPEIRTEYEAGTRMEFFTGRFGIDLTTYYSVSNGQIYTLGLDPATGYTAQTTNIGEIVNRGVEVLVNVTPLKFSNFSWDVAVNYTKNEGELKSLPEELGDKIIIDGLASISFVAQVGQPVGLFELTEPQRTAQGEIVVGRDGQPLAAAEKVIIPKADFDYTMGITNTVTFKDLYLSFDFDIRQGGLLYSRTKDRSLFTGNLVETLYNDRNPFIIPNSVRAVEDLDGIMDEDGSAQEDYVENKTPIDDDGILKYWENGGEQLDRGFLLPRSYVKLKRIVVGYSLPVKWIEKTPLKKAVLSLFGNNLLIWTPRENYILDPEVSTFGNDLSGRFGEYLASPPTRNYGVNIKLIF